MSNEKVISRGGVVIGAILIQLCLGAIYAWSVFTPALKADRPSAIASVYASRQLGLDATAAAAMKAELRQNQGHDRQDPEKAPGDPEGSRHREHRRDRRQARPSRTA